MRPHVGMFVNYFSIVKGGAESYVADLSAHLERAGHRVTIVTGRSFFRRPAPAREDARVIYSPCLYEIREMGRLIPGRVDWLANVATESLYAFFARRHVDKFDIVHCHGLDTARAALSCKTRRGPVMLTMHGIPTAKPRVGRLLRRLDALVSPSERTRELVRRQHGAEAHLIPMGADLDLFAPMERSEARGRLGWDDSPAVLFVGRLVKEKDVSTLLRAFRIVAAARPAPRLKIIGEGALEAALKREMVELGIGDRVEFLGAMLRERLPLCYSAADVVALPSVHETFPMVSLEALACRARLVISEAVEAVARRFPDVAAFPAGDHETLAARLMAGLDGQLPLVERSRLQPYTWARAAASYAAIYRGLSARRAA